MERCRKGGFTQRAQRHAEGGLFRARYFCCRHLHSEHSKNSESESDLCLNFLSLQE